MTDTLTRDQGGLQDTPSVLSRWAAVVPVFVEAGCELPESLDFIQGVFILDAGGTRISYEENPRWRKTVFAVLEKWFREVVAAWVDGYTGGMLDLTPPRRRPRRRPRLRPMPDLWIWCIDGVANRSTGRVCRQSECPTEAHIACAEALAEIVKGGE